MLAFDLIGVDIGVYFLATTIGVYASNAPNPTVEIVTTLTPYSNSSGTAYRHRTGIRNHLRMPTPSA